MRVERIPPELNNAVGLERPAEQARYMRRYEVPLVRASIFALPFGDATFDCVVCSQVIEHIREDPRLTEFFRVLPAGRPLILGTPTTHHRLAGDRASTGSSLPAATRTSTSPTTPRRA